MKKEYDVVIVGAGVAGLYAALQFTEDVSVLVVSKREFTLSNSSLAQGGVAAVLDKNHDNFKLHIADTLIAGKFKNNLSAVEKLVSEGPSDVMRLKEIGVDFDTEKSGELSKTLEAGHSRNRIVHHKDSTGKAIVDTLIEAVSKKPNVEMIENTFVFEINKVENGFWIGLLSGGVISQIGARYTLIATGGIGRIYRYTTNSAIATGDGIALAHMLGARINHLSRIQFHPTAFAAENARERFLISEAVRGEGAVYLNCKGERFAFKYDERGELAPRDVVSDAVIRESIATGSEKFYLDITHKDADFIKNRFPMIYSRCLEEGIDMTKDKIPVFPCQHYLMGGIQVSVNAQTTVEGLYAAGECTHTGVHGANRLASNSLLEALVYSRNAAQHMMYKLKKLEKAPLGKAPKLPSGKGEKLPVGIRTEIRSIMQDTYFVLPKPEKYEESFERVDEILNNLITGNYELTPDFVEARSTAICAGIILDELREGINL
ncbi:MAG: L-aspartate oxidase [Ruminococcus sp.]|nr:L-aspartate oxidase [Ruminococcus sp.]